MNALAGRDVAITSPVAGTTRDLIEVFLDLRGYPVTLVDTAGIRDSADPIEQEGVARARRRAEGADLTLWLDDGAGGQTPGVGSAVLSVRSKIDLSLTPPPPTERFAISAKTGAGVDRLLDALADLAEERMSSREPALITLERHRRAFEDAREALAATLGPDAAEWELVAEDLRRAASAMDRIVGRIGAEEVLGEIFARLCVGK
jgi:tRNA modification GTPase